MSTQNSLGRDLRALRTTRQMTLEHVATRLGRSVGWVSQVERDKSTPSVSDLEAFADLFAVPISLFFGTPDGPEIEQGRIVRASTRRVIGERESGLVEMLLSPDLTDSFEVVHSTFLPGASRSDNHRRPTQELAYLVSGRLDIWLDDQPFTVAQGDSFRIRDQSYRWSNPYEAPAVAVWIISPPVY